MDRCSSLRCTPSLLSLSLSLALGFQTPPTSTPVSHPPRSGSRSQGWKSPAILLIVGGPRFSLCFSLFPRLGCSCVAHYVRHTSDHRRRCRGEQGSPRSRLFIHSRSSENNIQFCEFFARLFKTIAGGAR